MEENAKDHNKGPAHQPSTDLAGAELPSGVARPAHKSVQRWNLPDGRVVSRQPAHEALGPG